MSSLGTKIVEGRKKMGMSQEAFSDRMGVTRQTVSKWELDVSTPRLKKIKKISEILEISIEDLLADKDEKGSKNSPVAGNSFDYKKLIKTLAIIVLVLFILYALYFTYKLIVLNVISSKVRQYMNVDNYYCKIDALVDGTLQRTNEIWYSNGNYKIKETTNNNDVISSAITYLDLNNKQKYVVNEDDKTYTKLKLVRTDNYDNGSFMYSFFPTIIKKESTNFLKYGVELNFIMFKFNDTKVILQINGEDIEFDKKTFLPISHRFEMKENKNTQTNISHYLIELNNVIEDDVNIPKDYISLN